MEPITATRPVPNQFPTITSEVPYRIAICGEAPGADEVVAGKPFVGVSGRLLDYLLNRVGIMRSACFLGNICQHRPPNNDITNFAWTDERIVSGLAQLHTDLDTFKPNLCVLLGGTALHAGKGHPESITNWRGSLFSGATNTPFTGRKCMGTFHPASALRVYEQTPLLLFDLKRARTQGESAGLQLPERTIHVAKTVEEVATYFRQLEIERPLVGIDIEGYVNNLTCISFAASPTEGFVIPFSGPGGNYWNLSDELCVWLEIKKFLENPSIEFVLQNGLYDRFVLAYTYGINIRNHKEDTLCKHWELYCELPKKLSLQASIYTLEPYYKDERGSEDFNQFWTYNGKDSCVTLEICQRQDAMLEGPQRTHFRFNMDMHDPLLYMELRGMRYDMESARRTATGIKQQVAELQHALNKMVGRGLEVTSIQQAVVLLREAFCLKRSVASVLTLETVVPFSKKAHLDDGSASRAVAICNKTFPLSDADCGELSILLNQHLNTQSSPQMCEFLYKTLALPTQLNKKTKKPTADATAILKLYKKTSDPVLKVVLKITGLLTQLETLEILCDPDGRIRCSYNVVGTETGRLSCSKSPTRSGYNLQTVSKKQRHLFRPDDGHYFFQCDLFGADGWTVAAHCKRLGDPTMYDDYMFGLKPALLIALMREGQGINNLSREQLLVMQADMKKKLNDPNYRGVPYLGYKRIQHGGCYLMGDQTMSDQILEDSWKEFQEPLLVPPKVCGEVKTLLFQRYPGVHVWHRWVEEQIKNRRELVTAVGQVRKIFGRPNDHDTLKQLIAHEPQIITTYATNTAVLNLWNDPENRTADGLPCIEPLHQVHDAVCGQFPINRVDWSLPRIRRYFNNSLAIAGTTITIPFEGAYGTSWGDLTTGTI